MPVIAAGGFVDGPTMAAAFALGAEGVQLGTRMVSAAESPGARQLEAGDRRRAETDTVFLNQHTSPALRALRTERTNALEFDTETNAMALFGNAMDLYFGGDMEAAIALSGQVAGRIDDHAGRRDHRRVRPRLPPGRGRARPALPGRLSCPPAARRRSLPSHLPARHR